MCQVSNLPTTHSSLCIGRVLSKLLLLKRGEMREYFMSRSFPFHCMPVDGCECQESSFDVCTITRWLNERNISSLHNQSTRWGWWQSSRVMKNIICVWRQVVFSSTTLSPCECRFWKGTSGKSPEGRERERNTKPGSKGWLKEIKLKTDHHSQVGIFHIPWKPAAIYVVPSECKPTSLCLCKPNVYCI